MFHIVCALIIFRLRDDSLPDVVIVTTAFVQLALCFPCAVLDSFHCTSKNIHDLNNLF